MKPIQKLSPKRSLFLPKSCPESPLPVSDDRTYKVRSSLPSVEGDPADPTLLVESAPPERRRKTPALEEHGGSQDARVAGDSSSRHSSRTHPPQRRDASVSSANDPDGIRPRKVRKRNASKAERGLPDDQHLRELAVVYLENQRRLWPKAVNLGLLPEATDEVLKEMVEDFKRRHAGGAVDPLAEAVRAALGDPASAYSRYSCENSSPHSIADQLVKELHKAHEEGRFVPWRYVYADYSVSGLDSGRQGYSSHKLILSNPDHHIDTTYIDDFTRASRDDIEWWRLAALVKHLRKRLIGASDGFDLSHENSELWIGIYNLLSRLFIKSLRQKVRRGMQGAVRRGTSVGKPALGYSLAPARSVAGNKIFDSDGQPVFQLCIHRKTRKYVRLAFRLYGSKRWSLERIARAFNRRKVDGSDGWTGRSIRQLLTRLLYIGVQIHNRFHQEKDPTSGKLKVIENPRKEWTVKQMPHLRIVSNETWKKVWKRLQAIRKASPITGRKYSRNENIPTTLVSATMFCEYCSIPGNFREIVLDGSHGKYKNFCCPNGCRGKRHCKLTTTKSLAIISRSLLGFVRETLLGPSEAQRLVVDGNAYIQEAAKRPLKDLAPLSRRATALEKKVDKVSRKWLDEEDKAKAEGYDRLSKKLQGELNDLRRQIALARTQNQSPPTPLKLDDVQRYFDELYDVLNQETAASAVALRALTGPIMISQKPNPATRTGYDWVMKFTPKLLPLLAARAKEKGCPDALSLEYLSTRIWTTPITLVVVAREEPKHEVWSKDPDFVRMMHANCSGLLISRTLGIPRELVKNTLKYARDGKKPTTKPPGRRRPKNTTKREHKYIARAAEVAQLKDSEGLGWTKIANQLGMAPETAERAYHHYHREKLCETVLNGQSMSPVKYSHLGFEMHRAIHELKGHGRKPADIAAILGCSLSTIYRSLKEPPPPLGGPQTGKSSAA